MTTEQFARENSTMKTIRCFGVAILASCLVGCGTTSFEKTETIDGVAKTVKFSRNSLFMGQAISGIEVNVNPQTGEQSLRVSSIAMDPKTEAAAQMAERITAAAVTAATKKGAP